MGKQRGTRWLQGGTLAILLAFCIPATASAQSSLSRWLGDEVTPALRELLSQHPRYTGQLLHIEARDSNGLADALVTVLTINLRGREGITLYDPGAVGNLNPRAPARIDDLQCASLPDQHLRLRVSVTGTRGRDGRVHISILEPREATASPHNWQWQGRLSRAEGASFREAVQRQADGSPAAPWTGGDIEAAASALHRELACSLRPQIETRLALDWPDSEQLPPVMANAVNRSRHLLGNYAELGFGTDAADYRVSVDIKPFRENTWQLWLTGSPLRAPLAPVQAVAYFESDRQVAVSRRESPAPTPSVTPPRGPAPGPALEFLDVQMLDASLGNQRGGSAELLLRLRLENRAEWPIDYSFSVSAGHYQHCIPEPAQYRHDRYGRLAGRLQPGESLVRPIVIKGAEHRPNPWFGPRKCAGFKSLEAFEDFPARGDAVTNYVRWGL